MCTTWDARNSCAAAAFNSETKTNDCCHSVDAANVAPLTNGQHTKRMYWFQSIWICLSRSFALAKNQSMWTCFVCFFQFNPRTRRRRWKRVGVRALAFTDRLEVFVGWRGIMWNLKCRNTHNCHWFSLKRSIHTVSHSECSISGQKEHVSCRFTLRIVHLRSFAGVFHSEIMKTICSVHSHRMCVMRTQWISSTSAQLNSKRVRVKYISCCSHSDWPSAAIAPVL